MKRNRTFSRNGSGNRPRRRKNRRCSGEISQMYIRRLNNADLHFLHDRLQNRFGGDLATVSQFVQKDDGMDRWLTAAETAKDVFVRLDILAKQVKREVILRREFARKNSSPSGREPNATSPGKARKKRCAA